MTVTCHEALRHTTAVSRLIRHGYVGWQDGYRSDARGLRVTVEPFGGRWRAMFLRLDFPLLTPVVLYFPTLRAFVDAL